MCIRDRNNITLDIYKLHLELTNLLHPIIWNNKYNNIENKIRFEKNKKTITINKKLNTLIQQNKNQEQKNKTKHTFYPRTINLSNTEFNKKETEYLSNMSKTNITQNSNGSFLL